MGDATTNTEHQADLVNENNFNFFLKQIIKVWVLDKDIFLLDTH